MKLNYDRKSKDPTYFAQIGFRDESGKATTKNVKRFGKHSELLKITDDPVAYCTEEIRKMNEEMKIGKSEMSFLVDFNKRLDYSDEIISRKLNKNIGYFYLQALYQKLEISKFIRRITKNRKITFDCDLLNEFLTFDRILDPCSKLKFVNHIDQYFDAPSVEHQHTLRFMDLLYEHFDEYIEWLFYKSFNVVQRDIAVMYYDCTNFYTEIDSADDDYIDPITGEIIKGLRQFGISKENRSSPIVGFGLFVDRRGIPVSMCIHPGNQSEQLTAVPLEKEILNMIDGNQFIYCADAGLGSYSIRHFNSMGGRAFVVTQSIKKLSKPLQDAVFNDFEYKLLSDGKTSITIEQMKRFDITDKTNFELYNDKAFKVITADKAIDTGLYEYEQLSNGKTKKRKATGNLHQKIIITFSRKMYEYQRAVRQRQIERAQKTLEMKDPEEIKKGNNDVRRFLKRIAKDKDGNDAEVKYVLNTEKIKEEEKYDGFYAVATNLDDDPKKILAISAQRYQIEEDFRFMKTNLDGRPFYHYGDARIRTHFLICYTALLIYRILQCMLDDQGTHITPDQLSTTLKNMTVVEMNGLFYHAAYTDSQTLHALESLFKLDLNLVDYLPKELRKKIKKLRK